jgi:beta-lactamase class A
MQGAADSLDAVLDGRLREISDQITSGTLGVSVYDYLSGLSWQFNGDRWFHAASVIKLAILVALYDAADQGRFSLGNRLHVRNRFMSVADGLPFRIDCSRDADAEVHAALGRTMQVRQLARRMIITSSNLATNLLVNLVGLERPIAKVAHKTGEISIVTHDAGAVFMPGRPPYLVAILSRARAI